MAHRDTEETEWAINRYDTLLPKTLGGIQAIA